MSQDIPLYIHVPFCRRKCRYCSFVSYENREAAIPAYLAILKKELTQRVSGQHIQTVYFGGGTPSLLPINQVENIIRRINTIADIDMDAEISFEANPGTLDKTYLSKLRKLGINRLSLGVQSMDDGELRFLGRIHNVTEAQEAFKFARDSGFNNINLDLIYGLPGQKLSCWKNTLSKSIELRPEHISLYALTLEKDSPMQHGIDEGIIPAIDDDLSAEEYEMAEDMLSASGYCQYEISNWSRPGLECKHNLFYWHNLPYIGVGTASHSCIDGHRMANTNDLDTYLDKFPGKNHFLSDFDEKISPELQLAETVILGLRLNKGISVKEINNRLGVKLQSIYGQQLKEMADYGLLETTVDNIKLTRTGRLLGNEVFWRFLPA
ncbi:radical SAM family heme chaperone HemW [Chloroflexota bacterium]